EVLRAYGLPVVKFELTKNEEEAVAAAEKIGYPVVIKIVSPDILHKTDFGGVRVNLKNETDLRQAYQSMLEQVKSRKPDADLWGVMVQQMAKAGGLETIIGMKRDPHFGPLLMFGLGGILVEVLKDVMFRVAPVNDLSAESMISGIRAHKLLEPFRGQPARDKKIIKECILRLSQLVTDFPDF
ncbi:MAG: acetate--CoA ligase family protein, partial [candidate division WOR-3 bacterium]